MANKKIKSQKPVKSNATRETARRTRMLQIIVAIFSIMLILSMVLSLASK